MNKFLLYLLIFLPFVGFSQTTQQQTGSYATFYRAEALFEKQQYGAAREEFKRFMTDFKEVNDPLYIKARYYEGIAALELFNNDAQAILEEFNQDYPYSIYKYEIYHRLGRFYFYKKEYKATIQWLSRVDPKDLDGFYIDEYHFKLGYSYFEQKQYPQAKAQFIEIKDGQSQYAAPAMYYFSHLSYMDGNYEAALKGFESLLNDDRFKGAVPFYVAQIYYQQGKYQEVIRFGNQKMDSISGENVASLQRIIGDSYYRLGKYDEAVPYLEAWNKNAESKRIEDYQLGFAYMKSKKFEDAIKMFDRATRMKDSLSQVATYHIAECYVALKNLPFARNAFEAASKMDFDKAIQEDATYNHAILSYKIDLNPYDEVEEAMNRFIEKYPNSKRKDDVYHYLINVYTSTKNYDAALKKLDNIPNKDAKLKASYQIVAFNYGVEQYQKAAYSDAIRAFSLVDRYPLDQDINNKAEFWTADAHFQLKEYDKAISGYKKFVGMPGANPRLRQDAYYNIGYAYFNQKKYAEATEGFSNFAASPSGIEKRKLADGYMRIADIAYSQKQDEKAIKYYKEAMALKSGQEDQALFYLANSYGFSQQYDNQIKSLTDIVNNYKKSNYIIPAIFALGNVYRNREEDSKALKYFEQIVSDYPKHGTVKEATLAIANIQVKRKEYDKAEANFRKVLTLYNSEGKLCEQAVGGIADIYRAQKKIEKIDQLAIEYPCGNISVDDQENDYFEAANVPYKTGSYREAIVEFKKYLTKFPNGKRKTEAKYLMASCHWDLKEEAKAVEYYKELLEEPNSQYTEIAAIRVSKTLYNSKKYDEAIKYYDRLEKVSVTPEVINNSQIGIMRCHAILENWSDAGEYAVKVLAQSNLRPEIKVEAKFTTGKNNYFKKEYALAKTDFDFVIKNTTTVFAAESRFLIAEMFFKQEDYTKSEVEVRALLKMKPSYDYWVAKALILQTRTLMAKNDLFQAEYTLNSVKSNYDIQDDGILDEANELWDELMQLKSKPKDTKLKSTMELDLDDKN